jgi:hypothetical protein
MHPQANQSPRLRGCAGVAQEPGLRMERLGFVKVAENEMHNLTCGACGRALAEAAAWKGSGERFYCNDFCAEAEEAESPSLVPSMAEDPQLAMSSRGSV